MVSGRAELSAIIDILKINIYNIISECIYIYIYIYRYIHICYMYICDKSYISYTFCRQPIYYSPYHGYNCSYLMFTNIIGSRYMNDCFAKNVTYIELYMGSFMSVVCVFLFRVQVRFIHYRLS